MAVPWFIGHGSPDRPIPGCAGGAPRMQPLACIPRHTTQGRVHRDDDRVTAEECEHPCPQGPAGATASAKAAAHPHHHRRHPGRRRRERRSVASDGGCRLVHRPGLRPPGVPGGPLVVARHGHLLVLDAVGVSEPLRPDSRRPGLVGVAPRVADCSRVLLRWSAVRPPGHRDVPHHLRGRRIGLGWGRSGTVRRRTVRGTVRLPHRRGLLVAPTLAGDDSSSLSRLTPLSASSISAPSPTSSTRSP